jgi:hypothetical protein
MWAIPLFACTRLIPLSTYRLTPGLNLFQVRISIPMGGGAKHLFEVYDGPGGRMLSNQRFNVHIGSAPKGDFTIVTLIPRSTTQLVPLDVNLEISFILNQVKLNGVSGPVDIDVEEDYRIRKGDDPEKWERRGPEKSLITVTKTLVSA